MQEILDTSGTARVEKCLVPSKTLCSMGDGCDKHASEDKSVSGLRKNIDFTKLAVVDNDYGLIIRMEQALLASFGVR